MARRQCFPRIDAPPPLPLNVIAGVGDDVRMTLDLMKIAGRKSKNKSAVQVVKVKAGRLSNKEAKKAVKKTAKHKGGIALEVARVMGATRPRTCYKSSQAARPPEELF